MIQAQVLVSYESLPCAPHLSPRGQPRAFYICPEEFSRSQPLESLGRGYNQGRLILAMVVQFTLSVLVDDIEPTEMKWW